MISLKDATGDKLCEWSVYRTYEDFENPKLVYIPIWQVNEEIMTYTKNVVILNKMLSKHYHYQYSL